MADRYALTEDFKCKYCGSMVSIREARGFIAVIVNASLLVTLPCLKCEVLLATSVMPCIHILAVCPLMKSDITLNSNTITDHQQARYTDG